MPKKAQNINKLIIEQKNFGHHFIKKFIKIFNENLLKIFIMLLSTFYFSLTACMAATVTLSWQRNTEPTVVGYVVYWGTSSRDEKPYLNSKTISDKINDGSNIITEISGLTEGTTYYFSVKSFDSNGNFSDYSNEVSVTIKQNNSNESSNTNINNNTIENSSNKNTSSQMKEITKKINFQPDYMTVSPEDFEIDNGDIFDEIRGYGWNKVVNMKSEIPYNPSYQSLFASYHAKNYYTNIEDYTEALIKGSEYIWELALPPGTYHVIIAYSYFNAQAERQSDNFIIIEDKEVKLASPPLHLTKKEVEVSINDGRLTLSFKPISTIYLYYIIVKGTTSDEATIPSQNEGSAIQDSNDTPIPIITTDLFRAEAPASVTFDGSTSYDPDGAIVRYVWDFGDGESSEGAISVHNYTSAGEYMVTLTVYDDSGAVAQTSTKIIITNQNSSKQSSYESNSLNSGNLLQHGSNYNLFLFY